MPAQPDTQKLRPAMSSSDRLLNLRRYPPSPIADTREVRAVGSRKGKTKVLA